MKRVIALLILAGMLSSLALSAYADSEPTAPSVTEDAPVTSEPPLTEDPPTTEEPPITGEPPITEEPAIDYEALLLELLCAVIDQNGTLCSLSAPEALDTALLQAVCTHVLERVPRFFYLKAIDVSIVTLPAPDEEGNLYRYDLRPVYLFKTGEELDRAKEYVKQETAAILEKIPENATDFEKALFLHDYLCTAFSFDGTHTVGNLYHLLQNGHGVCQAYTALYAYLLDQLGIPNDFAISDEMNHIWNIIELDGSWYHVDLTWDDPTVDQPGRVLHSNFLRSDEGIAETGHYNWIAPYTCESTLYEASVLPRLTGAVLFFGDARYAIHRSDRSMIKLDTVTMTGETVVDLSLLRWSVWENADSLYKEQFINLCTDGYLIYFNGPDSIWSYDPDTGRLETVIEHHPSMGYLYSLSCDGHRLISALSRAPGAADSVVTYTTEHRYDAPVGGLLASRSCLLCGHTAHYLTPPPGSFITALISTRSDTDKLHDLRLVLLVNKALLTEQSPLTVQLKLVDSEGGRICTTLLTDTDYGSLLVYERISAGGKEYSTDDRHEILGLVLRELENGSYTDLELMITNESGTVYQATLSADKLFPAPPVTEAPPTTEAPVITEDGTAPSPQLPAPEADEQA